MMLDSRRIDRNNLLWLCALLLLLSLLTLFVLHSNEQVGSLWILAADACVLFSIVWALFSKTKSIVFPLFNLVYFVFLLGSVTVSSIEGRDIQSLFSCSEPSVNQACFLAYLSIMVIDVVYIAVQVFGIDSEKEEKRGLFRNRGTVPTRQLRNFVLAVFIVSALVKGVMAVESMMHSSTYGYVSLYVGYSSRLPGIIQYLASFFYLSLFLYLASFPGKARARAVLVAAMLVEVPILLSGDRGEAVCAFGALLVYLITGSRVDEPAIKWGKKQTIALLFVAPLCLAVLQTISHTRVGESYDASIFDAVYDFFESQGRSLGVIGMALDYRLQLEAVSDLPFTFGHVIAYITQNAVATDLFGVKTIANNTVEMATSGFSMGSTLAYLWYPKSYLNGVGCGTSYIAEAYIDFSYAGVIAASIIVALILHSLDCVERKTWVGYALSLCIIRLLFELPRGSLFKFVTATFSVQNLLLLFAILVLSNWISSRSFRLYRSRLLRKERGC